MAETIRDVVIKIGLKLDGKPMGKVDLSGPIKQIDLLNSAAKDAREELEQLNLVKASELRLELERLNASAEAFKIDVSRPVKEVGLLHRRAKDASISVAQMGHSSASAGNNLIQLGTSAFTVARGFALIGAASEEDLQKALKTVAEFQGAFDIFRGGITVVESLRSVMQGWGVTTAALMPKNYALAASNVAVGKTAQGAAVGLTAMNAAGGPFTIALIALAAVLIPVISHFRRKSDEMRKTKKAAKDLEIQNYRVAYSFDRITESLSAQRGIDKYKTLNEQIAASKVGLETIDDQIIALNKDLVAVGKVADQEVLKDVLGSRGVSGNLSTSPGVINREAQKKQQEEINRAEQQKLGITEKLIAAHKEKAAQAERGFRLQEQADNKRTRALEAHTRAQKQLDDSRRRELESAKAMAEQESKSNQSIRARLGMLSDMERQRTLYLVGQAKKGTITKGELEELDQSGFAGGLVEEGFAKIDQSRGQSSEFLRNVGFDINFDKAKDLATLQDKPKELAPKLAEYTAAQVEFRRQLVNFLEDTSKRVKALTAEVNDMNTAQTMKANRP